MALLAYLAVSRGRHSRDALATLLWPESDQRRARANLRMALSALKNALEGGETEGSPLLATDRETLVNVALRGHCFPATGGLVPPGMPGHSPGIGLPYDPEGARKLLAEAGYPGGRDFPALDAWGLAAPPIVAIIDSLRVQWRETLGGVLVVMMDAIDQGARHL